MAARETTAEAGEQPPGLVRWALTFLFPYRYALQGLALLSLAEVLLRAINPWAFKGVIDYALAGAPMPPALARIVTPIAGTDRMALLIVFVGAGAAIQLGHALVLLAHGRRQVRIAQDLVQGLRERLFLHVQGLALTHHVRSPTGQTVYHLESDAACIEHLLFRGLFPVAFSVLTLVVMFGSLARIDPVLVLTALTVVPALYIAFKVNARALSSGADRVKQTESRVTGHLHETLAGIAVTKSYAREAFELRRYSDRATAAVAARLRLTRAETRFSFLVTAITTVGTAVTVAVGGAQVLSGQLTLGTLLVVVSYLGFVYGPMSVIANIAGTLQSAIASARRVRATFSLPAEGTTGGALPLEQVTGEVRFEHVSFSYGDRRVLDDITFTARPGELVALVGPSGAGKSTLVSLINRFYEPQEGAVLIDGVDVRDIRLGELRNRVAVVLQEAVLISGTIAENIRYGRLEATNEEVQEAAIAANAHEFIMKLPEGYATEMVKAGSTLSGGQRQRLSIARAFLKGAPILILDEPTSALDALSERLVFDAMTRLRQGRTTFVIAHRLSTVQHADRIVVLEGGRIVAEGRHEELLHSSPLYQRMCAELKEGRRQAVGSGQGELTM